MTATGQRRSTGDDPREQARRIHHSEHPPEQRESLWWLTVGPGIWALHFLGSYVTVAIWCAKVAGRDGMLDEARLLVGLYTVIALAGIAAAGWHGWRQHRYGSATTPHDFDTPGDRHRFIGFATLLLSGLSFVATVYVALAIVFVRSCS